MARPERLESSELFFRRVAILAGQFNDDSVTSPVAAAGVMLCLCLASALEHVAPPACSPRFRQQLSERARRGLPWNSATSKTVAAPGLILRSALIGFLSYNGTGPRHSFHALSSLAV